MREDGELTELKVEEEKVIIDGLHNREVTVQYKGHVDSKGDVAGWGSYFIEGLGSVYTGTFLDQRAEGIIVERFYDEIGRPDARVENIRIAEYLA